MPCVHPITAWRNTYSNLSTRKRAAPVFKYPALKAAQGLVKEMKLPCGKCIECRIDYSRQWAMRGACELQSVQDRAAFLTLTYDNKSLPPSGSLVKEDYQKFLKRLRRRGFEFTYMLCGEYGDKLSRPHYHAIIFGEDFRKNSCLAPVAQSPEMPLYNNPILTDTWGKGHVVFGDVSFASIQYVAGYITKKINGEMAKDHYQGRLPEFMRMSLKTPIGARWFDRFYSDVYPRDEFVYDGKPMRPPKYFQRRYAKQFPDKALDLSVKRENVAESMAQDWTPQRLAARKAITLAKFREHVRRYEKELNSL